VAFDCDGDRIIPVVAVLLEQPEQQLVSESVVGDPPPGHDNSSIINDRDVVMVFSPVDATERRHRRLPRIRICESAVHAKRSNGRALGPASHWPSVTSATGEVSVSAGAHCCARGSIEEILPPATRSSYTTPVNSAEHAVARLG
jgi:hypothetical protein